MVRRSNNTEIWLGLALNYLCSTCRVTISINFAKQKVNDALVPAVTFVEDSRSFISTAQLLCVVTDFFSTTLFTALSNDTRRLHVGIRDSLHFGALCAQS